MMSGVKMSRLELSAINEVFKQQTIMKSHLKILILEDNQNDADLLQRELKKSGLVFTSLIGQTRKEYEHALEYFAPDIILSDYCLPSFDAVTAFRIKQNKSPHIPFIIVSGIIGEENAVELIKNGVTDYTPKDKLFTLSQKITRALKDAEERKEKEITTEKLTIQTAELITANKELIFQNQEIEKQAANLVILSGALKNQQEKLKGANEELLRLNQHLEIRVSERTAELEILNHELKNLSLSKDRLLAVISHDLRNPLAVLLLASEELRSESENHIFDPIQPIIKMIHRSSHNILGQLNELVDWAKMQQEKTTLNIEKINLFSAVNQSFELLKANTTQKDIILENKVPADMCVSADALMLRSILQNLVTNSIKYSFQGGVVMVTAQCIARMAEICIIDSGTGMDANTQENLFTKSNVASVTGTNNEKGSSLGLILVKNFVTQHGGTLHVESALKKGTRVFFSVPSYF